MEQGFGAPGLPGRCVVYRVLLDLLLLCQAHYSPITTSVDIALNLTRGGKDSSQGSAPGESTEEGPLSFPSGAGVVIPGPREKSSLFTVA